MKIGGFQKLSLIEVPGRLSSVIFTIGCNFRCPFCYVPQLVIPERIKHVVEIPLNHIFEYLEKNRKFLDFVVITGGEPTVHQDLIGFIKKIKEMGFSIALETNGSNYKILKMLIEKRLIDYVEMDIKNRLEFEKYNLTVGGVLTQKMFENVKKSIEFLLEGNVQYAFRTTLVKEFHTIDDIIEISKTIRNARIYYLQNLKNDVELICGKKLTPMDEETFEKIIKKAGNFVKVMRR